MDAQQVQELVNLGFCVFPLRKHSKKPIPGMHWLGLQKSRPTQRLIDQWLELYPHTNWAIVTGKISGIVIVDIDGPDGEAHVRQVAGEEALYTASVRTANGVHLYYQHPGGEPIANAVRLFDQVDVRGDGGYVVAPGSLHPSGMGYNWIQRIDENSRRILGTIPLSAIKPVPAALLPLLRSDSAKRHEIAIVQARTSYGMKALRDELAVIARAIKGSRNHVLNRAAFNLGQLVASGCLEYNATVQVVTRAGMMIGLSETEASATVLSGINAGIEKPRSSRVHGR